MDDYTLIAILINLAPVLLLLLLGFGVGTVLETRHFASIRRREEELRSLPAINIETLPADWAVTESGMVVGSVVVSLDYFKRFFASLRMLFGGRIRAYEPLLERGRREAMLRMKQEAVDAGYDAVINVRLDSSRLATASGQSVAGVEMFAYGTGVKLKGRYG